MKNKYQPSPEERVFDDLINGNLTDARRRAKRLNNRDLYGYAFDYLGWGHDRSVRAAWFLKGECSFQEYCDAKED